MEEKRRNPRMNITLQLSVSSLFKQDNESVDLTAPLIVTDISKGGIGLVTDNDLPTGFYFNAALHLGHQDAVLYCVVRVLRNVPTPDAEHKYSCGCEFVGMAPILDFIFEDYAKEINAKA